FAAKEDQRGQKCKCPGCGKTLTIPGEVAVASSAGEARVAPSRGPEPDPAEQRTHPPAPHASDAVTHPSSSDPEATVGAGQPHAGNDAGLTGLLAPPQAGDELGRLGKYRVLKVLGHGGMGVVFQAEDPLLKRKVAIKAMLPALAASASAGQRF